MASALAAGFGDPVFDTQAVFRGLMSAIAYPGRVVLIDRILPTPAPLNVATTALCLSLVDFETPVWLDHSGGSQDVLSHLCFHCGMPVTPDPGAARFALIADAVAMPRLSDFDAGEVEYPDRSATIVIQVPSLTDGQRTSWRGPGIERPTLAAIGGLPENFWQDWDLNRETYPLGVDVFFTCGKAIVGLPRTITVEV
ncbi:phosphonate C-P lyase system protein PhnH [Mesorhizobium delmotii]|uniref:Phosphonate metabolism protein PhnH n=1 Tax=Mesorhizobium delmotii TaxID=1631247 RepID=A0A2P9AN79_9HYPH|nr:phosphonate C-P lyase system protein PhnH [Mesorhizobium delmotii]SJM32518.1 Phosphonate metabolism protein PhnH [Mesorhizobium delmotii]